MRKGLLTLVMLLIPVFSSSALADTPTAKPADVAAALAENTMDYPLGNPKAPITMVEYASLTCTHCAHFQEKVFPALKEKYIDTGKVKFLSRPFPLDEPALRAAMLTHCSGKDRYHTFLKVLFDKQDSWATQKNYLEILNNIAKLGGISGEAFDVCMKDKTLETAILQGKMTAVTTLNVNGTPSFFINGKKYDGAYTIEDISKALDGETAK